MNDLHDLMDHASDDDPNRPDDATQLLQRGRRRVNRRRGVTAVSGLAVTALAVAGGAAWLPSTDQDGSEPVPPVTSDETPTPVGSSEYHRVKVSEPEVTERCTKLLQNLGSETTWHASPLYPGPFLEGQSALVWPAGSGNSLSGSAAGWESCLIPQDDLADGAGIVPTPLPAEGDVDGIRAACSQFLGYDLSGWDVITSAGTDLATTVHLRSSNGYVAGCQLIAIPGHERKSGAGISHPSEVTYPEREDYTVWLDHKYRYAGSDQVGDYSISTSGQLTGPREAAEIVLVEPDGTEHVSQVADGGWYSIAEKLRLELDPDGSTPLRIKVLAPNGDVLAEYEDGEQYD